MLIWLFHIQRHSYRKMLLCCLKRVFNNFLRIFTLWSSSQVMLSRNQSSRMPNWPEILIFFKTILLKQMSPKKGVKIIVDEQRFASEKATIFHKIFFGNFLLVNAKRLSWRDIRCYWCLDWFGRHPIIPPDESFHHSPICRFTLISNTKLTKSIKFLSQYLLLIFYYW